MSAPVQRFLVLPVLLSIVAMLLLVAAQPLSAQSAPPTVSSVSPSSGPAAGGTTLTITGTGFVTSATTVEFNGVDAASVNVSSATALTAVTPEGTPGPVTILVTTASGSTTANNAFTYLGPPPNPSGVAPASGLSNGGLSVTITGENFVSGATVRFGGTPATSVSFVNSGQLTVVTPPRPAGVVNVEVTNPDGQSGSVLNGFNYTAADPPSVSSISPSSGPTTGGTSVTIVGANFVSGATVSIGGVPATSGSVTGAGTITAVTGARSAGTVSVAVKNPDDQTGTLLNGFTYAVSAPTVTSVSPNSGTTSGGVSVTITGTGFASGATVRFGNANATNVTVVNPNTITATTPARMSTGAVAVEVRNSTTLLHSLANAFTYTLGTPTVTSASPNSGPTSGGTVVTITGNGFVTGATVRFGGTNATNVTVISPTQITATTPPRFSSGAVAVEVRNSNSLLHSLPNAFTYVSNTATVTSISPSSGTTGGGTPVTITGTGFLSGASVSFGGTAATNVVVVNATTITARTPARSQTGAVAVQVTNPGGQPGQLTNGFTYISTPAPAVTAVSPSSGTVAGGNTVTITGTGFLAGATVQFANRSATNVTVVSTTRITAVVPSATSVGSVGIKVTNTDGKNHTLSNAYTYVGAPTITAISPSSGTTAGATQVTMTGTNFVAGTTVSFGGSAATNVTVVSPTQITARTPARSAGVVSVVVQVPGGQQSTLSNAFTYRNPAAVSSIAPNSGPTAGGTTITMTGSGFEAGATVTVGGLAATNVTVVSSTQITARTPARAAGAAIVEVRSADGILATGTPTFTYVSTTGTIVSGSIPPSGVGLFVFSGGSNEELVAAAIASGCPALRVAFFSTAQGNFISLIPGAPAFVNAMWNAHYAAGIPANTPLLASCR